jgi:hypothetical protein
MVIKTKSHLHKIIYSAVGNCLHRVEYKTFSQISAGKLTEIDGNNSSLQRKLSHFMTQKYQTRCLQKKLLPNDLNPLSDILLVKDSLDRLSGTGLQ